MLRYSFLILKFDESWVSVGTVSLGIKNTFVIADDVLVNLIAFS